MLGGCSSPYSSIALLHNACWHMENKDVVIAGNQHGFTKEKSFLTNLMAYYDGATALLDKGRPTDITCLDLCKTFDIVLVQ